MGRCLGLLRRGLPPVLALTAIGLGRGGVLRARLGRVDVGFGHGGYVTPSDLFVRCKRAGHDGTRASTRITWGVPRTTEHRDAQPRPSLTRAVIPDPAGWAGQRGPREWGLLERYGPQGGARVGVGRAWIRAWTEVRLRVRIGSHLLLDPGP